MNKKLVIALSLVIILTIIFIAYKIVDSKNGSKEIELTYKISAGIPYKWTFEIEDESIVKYVKSYVVQDDNKDGKVGAPVYTNYVFKGLKEGKTTVTFKMVRIDQDDEVDTIEKNTLKVDKNLNISLVAVDE